MSEQPGSGEQVLLERARDGDESAFGDLIGGYRSELHAHCYRMLGSVHDAEDALQDALLRAWRGLPGFEGRSSLRSWLYTIATNTALDLARRRARRELPAGFGPASSPGGTPPDAVGDAIWLEPYPDRLLDDRAGPRPDESPEARYEQRESLELAFVVALQYLPPAQRAVLILRDVVGFSARETAGQLATSVPSVTSALQRARASVQDRLPARSQQATLRSLGDERVRALAARYADAIERNDVDLLVSMLTSDATWSMAPYPMWYQGVPAIREFLTEDVSSVRWQHRTASANGQLALGCYIFNAKRGRYVAAVIDVLTLDGDRITAVDAFITQEDSGVSYPFTVASFARFGLPAEV
ncbi:MAG TPA: sigma-70 family RNA polymerase sigma factor [Streptosporangiaceae bacterium]|jgi:RNA polymerase sigma-70 factor (ECF subfamily)